MGSLLAPLMWCLLAAALFGASTPAAKVLLGTVDPLLLAGLLYLGGALGVAPFATQGGSPHGRGQAANLRRLGGAVLFGGVLGPAALVYALAAAPSASVSLWLNLETVATAVIAVWWFKESLGPAVWAANGLVVVAGLLLASPEGFHLAPAAALLVGAAACWGLDNNLTAVIDGFTPTQITLVKGAVAGAVNLCIALALGAVWPSAVTVLAVLLVGALGYGLSIVLYIRGAQHLGAARSQMAFSTAPFVGVAIAWFGLGEPVLGVQVAAGVLLVVAVAWMTLAEHGHVHHHPAELHTHLHRHDDDHHDHAHPGLPEGTWHVHEHAHDAREHHHPHLPDLHHRHPH